MTKPMPFIGEETIEDLLTLPDNVFKPLIKISRKHFREHNLVLWGILGLIKLNYICPRGGDEILYEGTNNTTYHLLLEALAPDMPQLGGECYLKNVRPWFGRKDSQQMLDQVSATIQNENRYLHHFVEQALGRVSTESGIDHRFGPLSIYAIIRDLYTGSDLIIRDHNLGTTKTPPKPLN